MLDVIQAVLRRLQDEIEGVEDDTSSDYSPSSVEDDAENIDLQIVTKHVVFKKTDDVPDCPICLESMRFRQHGIELQCGHRFHKKCGHQWLERDTSMRCPTCRAPAINVYSNRRRSSRLASQ